MRKAIRWAAIGCIAALSIGTLAATAATGATKGTDFKLYLLAQTKGEASTANPTYLDGSTMAAEKNPTIQFTRIPTALTATDAENALLQAAPVADVMLGLTGSSQIVPLGTKVAEETQGKPLITLNAAPEFVNTVGPYGAPNIFLSLPINTEVAKINADYMATLKPKIKKIGLLCVAATFGTDGCNAARKEFGVKGVTVATEQSVSAVATDLTQQVLAFKDAGVDAVLAFSYPNPVAVFANQMVQNGLDIPINASQSSPFAVATGSIQPGALANFSGSDYCVPTSLTSKVGKKWVKDYTAEFGYAPISSSAQAYDLSNFANAAVQKAGSVDPKKLVPAMKALSYDGVCGTYKADAGNGLWHTLDIVTYDSAGTPKIVKTFTTTNAAAAAEAATTTTAAAATTTTVKAG